MDSRFNLFKLVVLNESHVLIFGAPGTGKSTLIKQCLIDEIPEDYTIVIFDPVRTYEGYTDYYAPYGINPFDFINNPIIILDVIDEVLRLRFPRLGYVLTPAMEEMFVRYVSSKNVRSFRELINVMLKDVEEGKVVREDEVNAIRGLRRRIEYFTHRMFNETSGIVKKILNNELKGKSIGIDIHYLNETQRMAYVLFFLECIRQFEKKNVIFIIDEAHLYLSQDRTLLSEHIRLGRNFKRFFILITQAPTDIPHEIFQLVKVFVQFPIMYFSLESLLYKEPSYIYWYGKQVRYEKSDVRDYPFPPFWRELYSCEIHVHVTTKECRSLVKSPYKTITVTLNPSNLKKKESSITLKKCIKKFTNDEKLSRKLIEIFYKDVKIPDELEDLKNIINKIQECINT